MWYFSLQACVVTVELALMVLMVLGGSLYESLSSSLPVSANSNLAEMWCSLCTEENWGRKFERCRHVPLLSYIPLARLALAPLELLHIVHVCCVVQFVVLVK
jgi:hypothetical protein